MSIEITIARHAETEANISGVWQGQGDASLTSLGQAQAAALGERLRGRSFDLVLSSDLGRVLTTASIAGLEPEPDPVWREMDIGGWEGLTTEQVASRHPERMARLAAGEDVRLGSGETFREFGERIDAALSSLADRLDDGDRVLIVAHGGVVHASVSGVTGFRDRGGPFPIGRSANGSLSRIVVDDAGWGVAVFNDTAHLGAPEPSDGEAVVALVRHGETAANLDGRWQGTTNGPLTRRGRVQAVALADAYDGFGAVFTSPLGRARDTAAVLAAGHELTLQEEEALSEMAFGAWEDRTPEQIATLDPDGWAAFAAGADEPRGGSGDTYAGIGARIRDAVGSIAQRHPGSRVVAVSHGGAIRACAASVMGIDFADRDRLRLPGNASVSHVAVSARGPTILDYNVAWI